MSTIERIWGKSGNIVW